MFRSSNDITLWELKDQTTDIIEQKEIYDCDRCVEGWLSETDLEIHRARVHKDELKAMLKDKSKHGCVLCKRSHPSKDALISHIKNDHLFTSEDAFRVEREIFICHQCSQIFFNKDHLAFHIQFKHRTTTGKIRMTCPKCKRKFDYKNVWYHLHTHKIQSVASCRICYKKCKNRKHLHEHTKSHQKYLYCSMCGYETKKPELFNLHVQNQHKFVLIYNNEEKERDVRQYFAPTLMPDENVRLRYISLTNFYGLTLTNSVAVCIMCREICVGEEEMKKHIKEHDIFIISSRPSYTCSCGDGFSSKVLLKHHIFKTDGEHKETGIIARDELTL